MRWISFAQSDSLTRSILHLLPTTRGGIVTQALSCTIELFGDRPESAEVAIDGIRLNQPDGIRLDEAFLRLKEGGNSLVGIAVTIESSQQKSDLKNSTCMMEIFTRERSTRFSMPIRETPLKIGVPAPLIADPSMATSLILVNRGDQYHEITVRAAHASGEGLPQPLHISLAPRAVSEYSLAALMSQTSDPFNVSWGAVSLAAAEIETELDADVAAFAVYREAGTQRITSVLNV